MILMASVCFRSCLVVGVGSRYPSLCQWNRELVPLLRRSGRPQRHHLGRDQPKFGRSYDGHRWMVQRYDTWSSRFVSIEWGSPEDTVWVHTTFHVLWWYDSLHETTSGGNKTTTGGSGIVIRRNNTTRDPTVVVSCNLPDNQRIWEVVYSMFTCLANVLIPKPFNSPQWCVSDEMHRNIEPIPACYHIGRSAQ